jgi:methyl-accepting chemotaxis protein
MTQQNTALVEEASAAAQEMHDQAAALAAVVGLFKLAAAPAAHGRAGVRGRASGAGHGMLPMPSPGAPAPG